jgi:hypothetical protein
MRIPNEWRTNSAYNCLTDEEFKLFQDTHEVDENMYIDDNECECETYTIGSHHRCSCGNRRCYITTFQWEGKTHFTVEVW